MTTKMYYLVENGKQIGPFSFDDLKSKSIEPDTLIWFEGQEKWKKAKAVPELSALIKKVPPPIDVVDEESADTKTPPIPNYSGTTTKKYELATKGERLGGYLLTQIFTLVLFFILGGSLDDLESTEGFFMDIIYAGIGTGIFNGIFYPFFSGNLGHKLLGIKVIKKSDGSPIKNIFTGYSREFFKGALSVVIIPVIWLLFDDERQNLYDKIQGTLVVKDKD